MVGSACVQCWAFSQELPPENFSRVGRLTSLSVYGVLAPGKLRLLYGKRIAGGTAEGLPFVPISGMMGFFYFCNYDTGFTV